MEQKLFSVNEAAQMLGIGHLLLRKLVKEGAPHRRLGDRLLFSQTDVDQIIEQAAPARSEASK